MDHDRAPVGLPSNAHRELEPGEVYAPIVGDRPEPREVTGRSLGLGILMAAVFSFSAAYLGLKVGQVFEAAIPIAILAVGLEPGLDHNRVAKTFNISCSQDTFFLERHPKLAPVATFSDGIFLAGTCQGPKDIPDTVAQAGAAAARQEMKAEGGVAPVRLHFRPQNTCRPACIS